jgi:exodeoxyribonuclease VII large subunit
LLAVFERIERGRSEAQELRLRLLAEAGRGLRDRRAGVQQRAARLQLLGPDATLQRGYSICLDGERGSVVRQASDTEVGKAIRVMLASGKLRATVEEAAP